MTTAGLSAGLVTLYLGGCGVTILLLRHRSALNLVELISLGTIFGSGLVSLLLWSAGFLFSGPVLQGFVALGMVAFALAGYRTLRTNQIGLYWPRPKSLIEWLLLAVLLAQVAVITSSSLGRSLGWDGSFNWEIKARFAFLNGGVIPRSYYSSPSQALTHPEYPLLIPFTQLWLDLWMGSAHQFWEKGIFPLWNASGIFLLSLTTTRLTGKRWIGLSLSVATLLVPYLTTGPGGAASGYLDLPLGILYLVTAAYLLSHWLNADRDSFSVYLAALALLPWLKREGAILWFIAAAGGACCMWRTRAQRRMWLAILPGLLIAICWNLFLKNAGAAPAHDFVAVTAQGFLQRLERLEPIARAVLTEMSSTDRWSIFWFIVVAAILQRSLLERPRQTFLVFYLLVAPMLFYGFSYVFSAWPDYLSHMLVSLPRLLLQLVPLGSLTIALGLAVLFRADSRRPQSMADSAEVTPRPDRSRDGRCR